MFKKSRVLFFAFGIACTSIGLGVSYADTNYSITENNIEKERIQNKMVNSIDYFDTAKGSFTYHADNNQSHFTVDFNVNLKDIPSSNIKYKDTNNDLEVVFDGSKMLTLNNKSKKYKEHVIDKRDLVTNIKGTSAKSRYSKDSNGKTTGIVLRRDPSFMGVASEVLFNQNIALAYLEDQSKWAIDGSEDYLGLNATVIKGELPAYFKDKHNAETFKLRVHEETGILLKMEEYNQNGDVVYYVETHSIKLNSPLESEKFKTKDKPAGYSEDK